MHHIFGTIYRWCVAAFSGDLWNTLTPVDQVLDGRVVGYRPTSRSTHCSSKAGHIQEINPGTCCTCCVTKDQREPSACNSTQITCERVHWRVEWRSIFFRDESRFSLLASDGHTGVRRRTGERHRPHQASCCGGPSVRPTTRGQIWCFCKVK